MINRPGIENKVENIVHVKTIVLTLYETQRNATMVITLLVGVFY